MGRKFLILFLLFVTPALADKATVAQACRELADYQPGDADYKPGEDARGLPVAPADVQDTPKMDLPDTIDVAITFDQAAQLGLPTSSFTPQSYIGDVRVTKNGDVYFNGKRISQAQFQALCVDKK